MAITISGANNVDKILATDGVLDSISGFNVVGVMTAGTFDVTGKTTTGHLNIGSNIQLGNAGIITATTLVGNVTGNINHTSNLLLQIGGSEKFRVASSGQLGIGGANYGSAGQVLTSGGSGSAATWSTIASDKITEGNTEAEVVDTGSDGHFKVTTEGGERLRVSADGNVTVGAAVTISPVGNINATGIITATSFVGSGANLTSLPSQLTLSNNADNRVITGGSGTNLNGEENLTFNGSLLEINQGTSDGTSFRLQNEELNCSFGVHGTGSSYPRQAVISPSRRDSGSYPLLRLCGQSGIIFAVDANTERARIDSNGKILTPLGTTTRIGVADRTSGTGAGGSLCVTAGAARGSGQTAGDLLLATGRGNNSASAGTIKFGYNNGADGTSLDHEWLRIGSDGIVNIGVNASTNPFTYLRFGASQYGAADIRPTDEGSHKVGLAFYTDGTQDTTINPTLAMTIGSDGNVLPGADNTQNLGSSSKRWANIYTTDLHLSNEGKSNVVDGTWGDWTLQEGENKIYMINNRTGKKYSLKMEEE